MDDNDIVIKLTKWITDFIEVANPKLGDWAPCPYARQARVNDNISIKFATISELTQAVHESVDLLASKEVVVVCFDHNNINPVELQEYVEGMNKTLIPANYVILEDHPWTPEYINGVCMNFGHCGLLIIQKLDKLNKASDQLREKGYYNSWSKEDLDSVVSWRYK
jgi:hypothetical protein